MVVCIVIQTCDFAILLDTLTRNLYNNSAALQSPAAPAIVAALGSGTSAQLAHNEQRDQSSRPTDAQVLHSCTINALFRMCIVYLEKSVIRRQSPEVVEVVVDVDRDRGLAPRQGRSHQTDAHCQLGTSGSHRSSPGLAFDFHRAEHPAEQGPRRRVGNRFTDTWYAHTNAYRLQKPVARARMSYPAPDLCRAENRRSRRAKRSSPMRAVPPR